MKQTITKGDFRDAFVRMDRMGNFSYDGLGALYDYLEEAFEEEYDLDVIALCCDYNEDDIDEVLRSYNLKSIEELEENTTVVWKDEKRVLYVQY